MNVKDIMSTDVELVNPSESIKEAAERMSSRNVGFLPVGDDKLEGAVTDRDIVLQVVGKGKSVSDTKISDIISGEILYCYEDTELQQVADNMKEKKVRRLPVVNSEKQLVGVISLGDLAAHLSAEKAHDLLKGVTQ